MNATALALPAAAHAVACAARTDAGRRRALNEDRVLARPDLGLWAVADGMGGHRDGGQAAARLLDALEAPAAGPPPASGYARLTELERRAAGVNAELHRERGAGGPSGATLVALLLHEGHAACVWAGDSRAYLSRAGALDRLTRDHSLVQELVEVGGLSEAQRTSHPAAHVITRAVGAGPRLELDRRFVAAEPGDVFLLCSDGLTACLDDAEIARRLNGADLDGSADALLDAALAAGAPDNVSLVLVGCA